MDWMPQAIREGIFTIIFISGPLVVLAATLGLSVGIIQAATQIQEQTLGSAVKIIGLFIALIVGGFYMFSYLKEYTSQNISKAFRLVPRLGTYAKPRKNFLDVKDDEATKEPGKNVPGLKSPAQAGSGMSKIGDSLNEPEMKDVNVGKKADDVFGIPKSQVKEENKDIKKIEDVFNKIEADAEAQEKSAPKIEKPATGDIDPIIKPIEPLIKPRPRKSLTGALDRIRSSIEDFNDTNVEEGN